MFAPLLLQASGHCILQTTVGISKHLIDQSNEDTTPFSITAKVTAVRNAITNTRILEDVRALALEDEHGATFVESGLTNLNNIKEGDIVHVSGAFATKPLMRSPSAIFDQISIVGHDKPAEPRPASFQAIQTGSLDFRLAKVTGVVRDVIRSDTSPSWVLLKIYNDDNLLDLSVLSIPSTSDRLFSLVGSTIQAIGIVAPVDFSLRTKMGRIFWCWSDTNITTLLSSSDNENKIGDLNDISGLHPSQIIRLGRHKASGTVLATWHGDRMLIKTRQGEFCRAELSSQGLPPCGYIVEAIGFPESDLYHINLVRATWQQSSNDTLNANSTFTLSVPYGHRVGDWPVGPVDIRYHGIKVSCAGLVCSLPGIGNNDGILYVQDNQRIVPIDISSNPQIADNLTVGCRISVAGICIVDTPNWTPNALCQKADRFFLVVRSQEDITILARPPWWTPKRLFIAGGILLILLIAILTWNRSLIILTERRGRELMREQIGHVRANLKIDERTRLAVDLHDALSQNLTGIALQLDLVDRLTEKTNPAVTKHLGIATRTLQSCRNELRGCIWDLRSQALDAPTIEEAIKMTLCPHLDVAKLSLRFPVPRRKLDDNTMHTLLRIIRELVSNALRHGAAQSIRIAGALNRDLLLASVQDNGIGFDPTARPNSAAGHFGLDGIREQLRHFDGNITLSSSPGTGTKITFSIRLLSTTSSGDQTYV